MEEGGKELGRVVIAVIVIVALIAIAVAIFRGTGDGSLQDRIQDELDKVQTTSYVMPVEPDDVTSPVIINC